ncbi:hypothetical protein GCM10028784_07120 [Myceligenerans cantabricum]
MLRFDSETGFPPPGRTRLGFEEARAELVEAPRFTGSETRAQLWLGLERYVARFADLEALHASYLGDRPLLLYLWLAGSFVSTKRDPDNIDLTVFLDAHVRNALKGKERAGWISKAFHRKSVKQEFGVSPLKVLHRPLPNIFQPHLLADDDREYLQARGAYDDWWQRCRPTGDGATLSPTVASAATRRGYLEVEL